MWRQTLRLPDPTITNAWPPVVEILAKSVAGLLVMIYVACHCFNVARKTHLSSTNVHTPTLSAIDCTPRVGVEVEIEDLPLEEVAERLTEVEAKEKTELRSV